MIKFKIPPFYHLRGNENQNPLDKLYSLVEPKPSGVSNVYVSKEDAKKLKDLMYAWARKWSPKYSEKKLRETVEMTWLGYGPNETKEDVPEGFLLIQE